MNFPSSFHGHRVHPIRIITNAEYKDMKLKCMVNDSEGLYFFEY